MWLKNRDRNYVHLLARCVVQMAAIHLPWYISELGQIYQNVIGADNESTGEGKLSETRWVTIPIATQIYNYIFQTDLFSRSEHESFTFPW